MSLFTSSSSPSINFSWERATEEGEKAFIGIGPMNRSNIRQLLLRDMHDSITVRTGVEAIKKEQRERERGREENK
jgi:hypothetical protein